MNNIKSQYKNILITGGHGFIGSNMLNKYVASYPNINFINIDIDTYASNPSNVTIDELDNYKFVRCDIREIVPLEKVFKEYSIDSVIHFAAESHVDLSITNPDVFVTTNVNGTHNLLMLAKKYGIKRFHHVSTDEVYGELGEVGYFSETTPLAPNSPYSASKAGSDMLVRAYHETYGLDAVITRCSNNYGPNQDVTKLIPKFITNLIKDDNIGLYGKGANIRDWLYVEDHCDAIWTVFNNGLSGSVYNIGGNTEKTNLEIARTLLTKLGKSEMKIVYVNDRLGHDFRYAIDASKIKNDLGWEPKYTFENGISNTIDFYKSINKDIINN